MALTQVIIKLPGITSASDIDADIDGGTIELQAGEYNLSARLPRSVDEEGLSCRFDKPTSVIIFIHLIWNRELIDLSIHGFLDESLFSLEPFN